MPLKRQDYLEWEEYFMSIAFLSAQRSKDPVTQVGACIVNPQHKIVGIGYNGMPIGCDDDEMPWNRQGTNDSTQSWLNSKSPYVCHAELNAVLNKNQADVSGCKIYVALFPCNTCAQIIVQSGIKEIIFFSDKYHDKPPFIASKQLLDMAGIKYRQFRPSQKKVVIDFDAIERSPCLLDGSLVSKTSSELSNGASSKDGDSSTTTNGSAATTVNNNNKGVEKSCSFANRIGSMDVPQNLQQAPQLVRGSSIISSFGNWASSTAMSVMFVFVAVLFTWFGSLLHALVIN